MKIPNEMGTHPVEVLDNGSGEIPFLSDDWLYQLVEVVGTHIKDIQYPRKHSAHEPSEQSHTHTCTLSILYTILLEHFADEKPLVTCTMIISDSKLK